MKYVIPVVLLIFIFSVWWFLGRQPYVTFDGYSDPILMYHTPTWYGWESRGLKWISSLPEPIRHDFPDAQGWWHTVYLTIPREDLPPIDMENPEKTEKEWDKYYKWAPLGYTMPNDAVLSDR